MAEILVTAESVAAAAARIEERGERPTVERIRTDLGGGSPNAILPLLRTWKAQRQERPAPTEPEAPQEAPQAPAVTEVMPEVSAAMDALTRAILDTVTAVQMAERERAERQIAAMQEATAHQLATAQAAAAHQLATAQATADAAIGEAQAGEAEMADSLEHALARGDHLACRLTEVTAELERLAGEQRALRIEGERLAFDLSTVTAERDRLVGDAALLGRRVAELEQDRDGLAQRLADVQRTHEETLQQIHADHTAVVDQVRQDLAGERARVDEMHRQMTTAAADLARAQGELVERGRLLIALTERLAPAAAGADPVAAVEPPSPKADAGKGRRKPAG